MGWPYIEATHQFCPPLIAYMYIKRPDRMVFHMEYALRLDESSSHERVLIRTRSRNQFLEGPGAPGPGGPGSPGPRGPRGPGPARPADVILNTSGRSLDQPTLGSYGFSHEIRKKQHVQQLKL